jgi:hypothetical protein
MIFRKRLCDVAKQANIPCNQSRIAHIASYIWKGANNIERESYRTIAEQLKTNKRERKSYKTIAGQLKTNKRERERERKKRRKERLSITFSPQELSLPSFEIAPQPSILQGSDPYNSYSPYINTFESTDEYAEDIDTSLLYMGFLNGYGY